MISYQLHRAPLLDAPPKERLLDRANARLHYPEIWVKYPLGEYAVACDFSSAFIAMADFCVILNEITRSPHPMAREGGRFRGFRLEETLRYYHQLSEWYDGLAEYKLSAREIVLPHQMKIQ